MDANFLKLLIQYTLLSFASFVLVTAFDSESIFDQKVLRWYLWKFWQVICKVVLTDICFIGIWRLIQMDLNECYSPAISIPFVSHQYLFNAKRKFNVHFFFN